MIKRYSRPEMAEIWSDSEKLRQWTRVEEAVCAEWAHQGLIPAEAWLGLEQAFRRLESQGGVDPVRVVELEETLRHDVIAYTTALAEKIGPLSRYVHFGLTSSDVLDTALALQIGKAGEVILGTLQRLEKVLAHQAGAFQHQPCMGRSHGMAAEPMTFGMKFLGWLSECRRNQARLRVALEDLRFGKLSGAVGTQSHFSPDVEERVLARLGLLREPVSTQVIPRDRHAWLLSTMAVCAGMIERIAVEVRHLQRTEVGEVREGFAPGQKGSSAMPHKRNPVSAENLTGAARLLRSYAQPALEDIALWHERDISHSAVERIALPDAFILLHYALERLTRLLEGLEAFPERMERNLQSIGDATFSGHLLLQLVQAGASREDAYRWVQEAAFSAIDRKTGFVDEACAHPRIRSVLPEVEVRRVVSLKHHLRNVDALFERVLNPA